MVAKVSEDEAEKLFGEMSTKSLPPDVTTFWDINSCLLEVAAVVVVVAVVVTAIVAAATKSMEAKFYENGMLDEVGKLFGEMSIKNLPPNVTTFRTLIDAYLKDIILRTQSNVGTTIFCIQ
ncbi:hypothetical protein ACOSP7_006438 [Xanthoceras sorbifolium]